MSDHGAFIVNHCACLGSSGVPAGFEVHRSLAPRPIIETMPGRAQEALREAWLGAQSGQLSALSQANAWAMRVVWRDDHPTEYGMLVYISETLQKAGGGKPTPQALGQFFAKVGQDESWFPGKLYGHARGRKRALSGGNAASIVRSAMTMKAQGNEPTYARLVTACPNAVTNPKTGQPVDKHRIYDVLRGRCCDEGSSLNWEHQSRLSRSALLEAVEEKRLGWALWLRDEVRHSRQWYYRHCVWTDIYVAKSSLARRRRPTRWCLRGRAGKGGRAQTRNATHGTCAPTDTR